MNTEQSQAQASSPDIKGVVFEQILEQAQKRVRDIKVELATVGLKISEANIRFKHLGNQEDEQVDLREIAPLHEELQALTRRQKQLERELINAQQELEVARHDAETRGTLIPPQPTQ